MRAFLSRVFAGVLLVGMAPGFGCADFWEAPEGHFVDAGANDEAKPIPLDAPAEAKPMPRDAIAETAPPFCSRVVPAPQACSDFDEGGDPGDPPMGWDNGSNDPDGSLTAGQGGATRTLDGHLAFSPPFSLAVTTPSLAQQDDVSGYFLLKVIPKLPSLVEIRAEVYLSNASSAAPHGGGEALAALDFGELNNSPFVGFALDYEGWALWAGDSTRSVSTRTPITSDTGTPAPLPAGEWIHLSIILTDTPSDAEVAGSIKVDATGSGGYHGSAISSIPSSISATTSVDAWIGMVNNGPMAALQANFDDVFIYYE